MSNLYLTPYLKYVTAKRDSSTHTKWNKYFKIEKKKPVSGKSRHTFVQTVSPVLMHVIFIPNLPEHQMNVFNVCISDPLFGNNSHLLY